MPPYTNEPPRPARIPISLITPTRRMVVLLCILAFLGFSGGLESFAGWGLLGEAQKEVRTYLDSSEKKAAEAFAVARAMNAAISFLKSADLSVVFVQAEPMEVLEPIDDLVKQFSDVMVISIVSILLQRLFLAWSQVWALTVFFPVGCTMLALSFGHHRYPIIAPRLAALGRSIVLLSLFARFAVIAAGLVGANITQQFLASDLDASMSVMHETGGNLSQFTDKATAAPVSAEPIPSAPYADSNASESVLGRVRSAVRTTANNTQSVLDRGAALVSSARGWIPDRAAIEAVIGGLPSQILKAIEIFLVQTLLTPLGVAWFSYAMLKGAVRPVPVRVEAAAPPAPQLTHAVS